MKAETSDGSTAVQYALLFIRTSVTLHTRMRGNAVYAGVLRRQKINWAETV